MSSFVFLEWSASMFEPVLPGSYSSQSLERITQASHARTLSNGVANLSLTATSKRTTNVPARLDVAMTIIKQLASKAAESPSIVNGSVQSELITFATFDHAGLGNQSSKYEEFRDKLINVAVSSPPTKISYVSLLQNIQANTVSLKNSAYVIVVVSSSKNLVATHQFASLSPLDLAKLLPLPHGCPLLFLTVSRGMHEQPSSLEFFQNLATLNCANSDVYECSQENNVASDLVDVKLATDTYQPFLATLTFGGLSGRIMLIPSPVTIRGGRNMLSEDFQVLGLMEKTAMDKLYPTRAYVLVSSANAVLQDGSDIFMEPHFAPLLHAGLRMMPVPGKVVLVSVAKNWYGYIETVEDAKTRKKSGLVLNLFPEGASLVSGGPPVLEDLEEDGYVAEDAPSYANAGFSPVWTSAEAVQTDVGRMTRMAKRLPEKMDVFYKELNKLRLHALSTGNRQFLKYLADVIERESHLAPSPKAAQELLHALAQIRPSDNQESLCGPLKSVDGIVFPLDAEL